MQPSLMQPSLLQDSPSLDALLSRNSLCARLAKFLLSKRGHWIDGRTLAKVAGAYGWRTRVSDLRKAPWWLSIDNRVRTVEDHGVTGRVSEYRLRG